MQFRSTAALVCMIVAASAGSVRAQSGSATMAATVMTAITVTGSDLAFGAVLATGTKTVAPAAGGRFIITLAANTNVTIDYQLPATLGTNVAINNWFALYNVFNDPNSALLVPILSTTGSYTTSTPTGSIYIWIGARVTTTGAAVGSYSQPIRITLTYN